MLKIRNFARHWATSHVARLLFAEARGGFVLRDVDNIVVRDREPQK